MLQSAWYLLLMVLCQQASGLGREPPHERLSRGHRSMQSGVRDERYDRPLSEGYDRADNSFTTVEVAKRLPPKRANTKPGARGPRGPSDIPHGQHKVDWDQIGESAHLEKLVNALGNDAFVLEKAVNDKLKERGEEPMRHWKELNDEEREERRNWIMDMIEPLLTHFVVAAGTVLDRIIYNHVYFMDNEVMLPLLAEAADSVASLFGEFAEAAEAQLDSMVNVDGINVNDIMTVKDRENEQDEENGLHVLLYEHRCELINGKKLIAVGMRSLAIPGAGSFMGVDVFTVPLAEYLKKVFEPVFDPIDKILKALSAVNFAGFSPPDLSGLVMDKINTFLDCFLFWFVRDFQKQLFAKELTIRGVDFQFLFGGPAWGQGQTVGLLLKAVAQLLNADKGLASYSAKTNIKDVFAGGYSNRTNATKGNGGGTPHPAASKLDLEIFRDSAMKTATYCVNLMFNLPSQEEMESFFDLEDLNQGEDGTDMVGDWLEPHKLRFDFATEGWKQCEGDESKEASQGKEAKCDVKTAAGCGCGQVWQVAATMEWGSISSAADPGSFMNAANLLGISAHHTKNMVNYVTTGISSEIRKLLVPERFGGESFRRLFYQADPICSIVAYSIGWINNNLGDSKKGEIHIATDPLRYIIKQLTGTDTQAGKEKKPGEAAKAPDYSIRLENVKCPRIKGAGQPLLKPPDELDPGVCCDYTANALKNPSDSQASCCKCKGGWVEYLLVDASRDRENLFINNNAFATGQNYRWGAAGTKPVHGRCSTLTRCAEETDKDKKEVEFKDPGGKVVEGLKIPVEMFSLKKIQDLGAKVTEEMVKPKEGEFDYGVENPEEEEKIKKRVLHYCRAAKKSVDDHKAHKPIGWHKDGYITHQKAKTKDGEWKVVKQHKDAIRVGDLKDKLVPTVPLTCTAGGSPCKFPFYTNGEFQTDACTDRGAEAGKTWCATSLWENANWLSWDWCDKEKCKPTKNGEDYPPAKQKYFESDEYKAWLEKQNK